MRFFAIVLALFSSVAFASAQTKTNTTLPMPPQFVMFLDAYRGWTPQHKEEPLANSVYNWATRALHVTEGKYYLIPAARNWVFMRSEASFLKFAQEHRTTLKTLFGMQYLARGLQTAVSMPFDAEIDGLYQSWYGCVAATSVYEDKRPLGSDFVLAAINWQAGVQTMEGSNKECADHLSKLSRRYGVVQLTADDLMVIGFLHRRHVAATQNPANVSAEFIRKTVADIFKD